MTPVLLLSEKHRRERGVDDADSELKRLDADGCGDGVDHGWLSSRRFRRGAVHLTPYSEAEAATTEATSSIKTVALTGLSDPASSSTRAKMRYSGAVRPSERRRVFAEVYSYTVAASWVFGR